MGRPTKYKEEYDEQTFHLCLLGATDKDLASAFDVEEQTINNWKKDFPSFFESIKRGKVEADARVANALYEKATGGDTTAMIFWLKNRRQSDWRDKQDLNIEAKIESETDEQLTARLTQLIGKAGVS